MEDREAISLHWDYPLFIIGTADDSSVIAAEYDGHDCCLIYREKQLAELYVEQTAEDGGGDYHLIIVPDPRDLFDGLTSVQSQGVSRVAWDVTLRGSYAVLIPIAKLLSLLSTELADDDT